MKRQWLRIILTVALTGFFTFSAQAYARGPAEKPATVPRAYGPGGPAPAMKDAARIFSLPSAGASLVHRNVNSLSPQMQQQWLARQPASC